MSRPGRVSPISPLSSTPSPGGSSAGVSREMLGPISCSTPQALHERQPRKMATADLLAAALARSDLSPATRTFLLDLQRQSRRRPLSAGQMQAAQRITDAPERVNFTAINRAALGRLPDVLGRLLPGGRSIGAEWVAGSIRVEAGRFACGSGAPRPACGATSPPATPAATPSGKLLRSPTPRRLRPHAV